MGMKEAASGARRNDTGGGEAQLEAPPLQYSQWGAVSGADQELATRGN